MTRIILIAVLTVLLGGVVSVQAGVVVVVYPDVPVETVGDQTLERIFLGKKTRWNDDLDVVPVMLKDGPVHDEFVEEHLDRSVSRFVTYWKQALFTGRGVPPRSFATEDELIFFVSRTPGAVGYVSDGTPVDGVRIIAVE